MDQPQEEEEEEEAHEGTAKDAPPSRASQSLPKDVVDVNRFDVLLGRGTGPNEHPGNRTFRHQVKMLMKEYNEATSRVETGEVLLRVIDTVTRMGGRFLKKIGTRKASTHSNNHGKRCDVYEAAAINTILEKTRQAFHYLARKKTNKAASKSDQARRISKSPSMQCSPVYNKNTRSTAKPALGTSGITLQRTSRESETLSRSCSIPSGSKTTTGTNDIPHLQQRTQRNRTRTSIDESSQPLSSHGVYPQQQEPKPQSQDSPPLQPPEDTTSIESLQRNEELCFLILAAVEVSVRTGRDTFTALLNILS